MSFENFLIEKLKFTKHEATCFICSLQMGALQDVCKTKRIKINNLRRALSDINKKLNLREGASRYERFYCVLNSYLTQGGDIRTVLNLVNLYKYSGGNDILPSGVVKSCIGL